MRGVALLLSIFVISSCGTEEPETDGVVPVLLGVGGEPSWSSKDVIAVGFGPYIYYCDPHGENKGDIKPEPKMEVYDLDWSPDGGTIIFEGYEWTEEKTRLYKAEFPGGRTTLFLDEHAGDPAWSPDGKYIAYTKFVTHAEIICIVPAAGGETIELVPPGDVSDPDWGPNGENVFYTKRTATDKFEIWAVNIKDKKRNEFVTEGMDAAWHPFGKRLAIVRKLGENFDLYLIDPATGRATEFIGTPRGESEWWALEPTWSPKGDWLAFHGIREYFGIYKKQVTLK
jgi:Tol biopolymer transport system component